MRVPARLCVAVLKLLWLLLSAQRGLCGPAFLAYVFSHVLESSHYETEDAMDVGQESLETGLLANVFVAALPFSACCFVCRFFTIISFVTRKWNSVSSVSACSVWSIAFCHHCLDVAHFRDHSSLSVS